MSLPVVQRGMDRLVWDVLVFQAGAITGTLLGRWKRSWAGGTWGIWELKAV